MSGLRRVLPGCATLACRLLLSRQPCSSAINVNRRCLLHWREVATVRSLSTHPTSAVPPTTLIHRKKHASPKAVKMISDFEFVTEDNQHFTVELITHPNRLDEKLVQISSHFQHANGDVGKRSISLSPSSAKRLHSLLEEKFLPVNEQTGEPLA